MADLTNYENNALEAEIDEDDPEERDRKRLAAKRVFFLLLGVAIFLFGVLVFEIVELSMGGRI